MTQRTMSPAEFAHELQHGTNPKTGKPWRKARGQLARPGNRFCCLGVMCELSGAVYVPHRVAPAPITQPEVFAMFPWLGTGEGKAVSLSTLGWANDREAGWPIEILNTADNTYKEIQQ